MNNLAAFLAKTEPFNKLPPFELERLALMARVIRHAKGESLYSEGEDATTVWLLQEGRLGIFKYSSTGKPLAIETIQPGQLFGTLCRLGQTRGPYPCTAVACTATSSIQVPDSLFQSLCVRYPAMVASACRLCSVQLGLMKDRAASANEPVLQRIVKTLFDLQAANGNKLPYTRREISEFSATTVETTIRVLSGFERKHWIHSERGHITLLNIPQLQACLG